MRTRISGVSVALAAAGILCLGSNLPASHGHGGGGGGGHGGGHMGGGGHFGGSGGHFGGGGGHIGGSMHHGGFGGGGYHMGGGFGGSSHHFSAPQQHFGGQSGGLRHGSGQHIQNFGGTTHRGSQFNGGTGGIRSGGSLHGQHQHSTQPSFSSRHSGSNLATRHQGTGNSVAGAHHGLSNAGSHSRHLSGNGGTSSRHLAGGGVGSGNSFASRHAGHAGGHTVGAQHTAHRVGGSGQGGNFASRHNGQHGLTNVADRGGAGGSRNHGVPNGAVGANHLAGRGHSVNAHQMWNNVGRGVGTGLSSFHNQHHAGYGHGGNGNNFARHGNHHGYYGNNFRYHRLWYGFGSGFWPYYAWNYRPFWGAGYGWGGWGGWGWRRPWRFGFGFGYPYFGLGYGGLGYGGYGYGYGGYGGYGYNSSCLYTPGYSVYSNGYSYAPASAYYGSAPVTTTYADDNVPPASAPVEIAQADPNAPTAVRAQSADNDLDFGASGEAEFKAGNYDKAVKMWRHAVLDDPKNGVLVMMLGQGLFASGKFDEAAGATQQGMLLLKEEDWGVVVTNYRELYAKIGDYTTQLRVLEKARKDKPEDPALRFLLGFHYGYLGFPNEATRELDKAITLAPQDELAGRLKEVLDAKLKKDSGKATTLVPPVPSAIPKKTD